MNARQRYYRRSHWRRWLAYKFGTSGSYVNTPSMVAVLKEVYCYDYTAKEETVINLVHRYRTKASQRLVSLAESYRPEAKRRADDKWKRLVNAPNPLLKAIAKDDVWRGSYLPVPISYGVSQ